MNDMEQNRQIVQEGLDKRANKRKKAITEAEQEAITTQMFDIVNTNALTAPKFAFDEIATSKANKRSKKKSIMIRNMSAINAAVAFLLLVTLTVLYTMCLMEIKPMAVISVLPIIMLIYNLCILTKAQKKLKRRK